ncbi:tRNA wybutosine-synthesizing protein 3 homolog isoform X3 [Moschus berezovskii]|uniref:tRNA wybutosine-synthesizing protein 3 homolog isoform X3 n=1 Tax=Moschus berezovskii TaxID=68408 RepID=UPI0024452D91|nr:tRNA wybutosine-synthesizing protein 3 homolog isoform X3 [Moschus berezovskii]
MDLSAEFKRWKAQCLSKADLSRKGSVDEDVLEIVQLLNGQEQFFTTSSCAGRIILLDGSINGSEVQKKNCCWLLVTHKACVKDDVIVALKKANGDAILKFEPLVLHVQCRQLQDAQTLHSVAIDSGFRNSGITVGKRGKTMLKKSASPWTRGSVKFLPSPRASLSPFLAKPAPSDFCPFMHWRRKWRTPTPVFLRGESQRRGSLVGCTESDTTEAA